MLRIKNLMNMKNFKFFLYDIDYYSEYSQALFEALKDRDERTFDPNSAHVFLTCFSNERQYPEYGKLSPNIDSSIGPAVDVIPELPHFNKGRHLTFYHTKSPFSDRRVKNIPYCKLNFDPRKDFIISPPALSVSTFEDAQERKYLVSFKGDLGRESDRFLRLQMLKNIRDQDISNSLIIDRSDPCDYQFLIKNSTFSIVVDGDCHWSYRLTEVINMGSIPVIIVDDEWTNIPFSNMLDYSSFSIIIHKNDIASLKDILENMPKDGISELHSCLKRVNEEFFSSIENQLQIMLRFLASTFTDLPLADQLELQSSGLGSCTKGNVE
jgi:hypothetical protein